MPDRRRVHRTGASRPSGAAAMLMSLVALAAAPLPGARASETAKDDVAQSICLMIESAAGANQLK